jgi:iron complex outermembrane receptor protein
MQCKVHAAVAAVLLLPGLAGAQQSGEPAADDVDEVVVIGRSVSTGLTQVEVNQEMLVDTATVLKDIPGANVNANGPVTGIAQYRGMYGDRVSVVIDHLGVVSGGPNAMDAPLSYVSPMITSELTVTRGVPSVSLAPESIGGHISTQLGRGEFAAAGNDLNGFVGSRYSANGNLSTTAGRLVAAGENHKVSLMAEVDDGDDVSTPAGTVLPSRLHRERSDVSYAYSGAAGSVLLFAGRLDTDDTGTPALPMDIRFIDTALAGARASFEISDALQIDARLGWNDVEHLMDNFGLREAPMPMAQRQNFTTGSGVQLGISGALALRSSSLEFGVDASNAAHDATITNPNNAMFRVDNFVDVERDVASAFVEWRIDSTRGQFEVGLRAKRITADAGTVSATGMMGGMADLVAELAADFNAADRSLSWTSPDAVAKYSYLAASGTEWRLELGHKTRAPSYQELYLWLPLQATGGLADGRSYIGARQLDVERSTEIVIGFGRDVGRVALSPQVYYRRVNDYIQGVPSSNMTANMVSQMMSGQPALEFANVDAEIWGADIAVRVELADHWYLDGIASYVRGKRRDVSDNLYRLAPPNASIGITRARDGIAVTAELVGYAEQDNVSVYNAEQATAGYGLVNAMFEWRPGENLRLEARIDNLLDKTYQDHVAGINRAGGSDIPVGERLYGLERTASVGVIWSF